VVQAASFGTIVVGRVCDGIVLVCSLWISLAWISFMQCAFVATSWIFVVGVVSSVLFDATLIFNLASQRIDLRRFGVMEGIATRWDRLVKGISSVLRGNTRTVVLCSIGVLALDALTLASSVRSFGINLSPAETLMLLGLASLSTRPYKPQNRDRDISQKDALILFNLSTLWRALRREILRTI
jgi:hypothetical protein